MEREVKRVEISFDQSIKIKIKRNGKNQTV